MTPRRAGDGNGRRRWPLVVFTVGLVAAGAVVTWAMLTSGLFGGAVTARDVALTVRCPTCIGESVADSTSPVAAAMRDEISRQAANGATVGDVQDWFAARYGDDVLLEPPMRGYGWTPWVLASVLGAAGVIGIVRRRGMSKRHHGRAIAGTGLAFFVVVAVGGSLALAPGGRSAAIIDDASTEGTFAAHTAEILEGATADGPADADLAIALAMALLGDDRPIEAADQLAVAERLKPLDANVTYLRADALLRAGRGDEAGRVLDALLDRVPEHAPALLLRGTMLWQRGDPRGGTLLEDFVRGWPDDPAAAEVRNLLFEAEP